MTLHQPSSEIWDMLDHLVLMVQGHIIFNGPANQALDFFVSCGYARPLHVNPSDYFLDIVQCQEDDDAQAVRRTRKRIIILFWIFFKYTNLMPIFSIYYFPFILS